MPVSPGTPRPSRRSPWRLRLVVGAIVTAIAGAAISGWLIARTSSPPSGPVILVSIESLRADHLGAYGYAPAATPNLDALAAAGIVFERAYAHSPLTLPSHVSILSGRLPIDTGLRDDEGQALPAKLPLVSTLLHKRGFKTAGIVSSGVLGRQTGLAAAFDFFDDEMPPRTPEMPAAGARRDGAVTLDVAKRWMDQQGNRFFLFLHLDDTTTPPVSSATAAASAASATEAGRNPYDGQVTKADQVVGGLVSYLKARNLYDRAIIVVTSDHGEALGDHGETGHGLFLYASTLRTPLIVKMPRDEAGGARRANLVQHVDIAPTILDLMGAPRPSALRGRSLRHLLGSNPATLATNPVYAESFYASRHFGWSPLHSIADDRYRYIRAPRPELYDLQQDAAEQQNLAAANPAKVQELDAVLQKVLAAAPPPPPARLTPEDRLAIADKVADKIADKGSREAGSREESSPVRVAAAAGAAPPVDPKDRLAVVDRLHAAARLAADAKYSDAIAAYREVLAADAGVPEAWRQTGKLLLTTGQPGEALQAFREALSIDAEDLDALLGSARALARLGRYEDAERHVGVAAKLDPQQANELLVRLELRQKDYVAAQRAAAAAKEGDPASPMPAFARGVELYQAGKYQEALPALEEALQQAAARPVQMPDVRFYAGDTLAHLRKYSDAEARLADELKWFPENVRAREALAAVYQETGRSTEAAAVASELVRVTPTPEGYAAANRISTALGDKSAAAALRAEGRKLFGEAALRAAEVGPRQ